MQYIKLNNGKEFNMYNTYTYGENSLTIELLNTTLSEVETEFNEENIGIIEILSEDKTVEKLYNGYTTIIEINKRVENISKSYLGTGSINEEESCMVCTIRLKIVEDFKKQLESATKKIEDLINSNNSLTKANKDLSKRVEELDGMLAMVLLGSTDDTLMSPDELLDSVSEEETTVNKEESANVKEEE